MQTETFPNARAPAHKAFLAPLKRQFCPCSNGKHQIQRGKWVPLSISYFTGICFKWNTAWQINYSGFAYGPGWFSATSSADGWRQLCRCFNILVHECNSCTNANHLWNDPSYVMFSIERTDLDFQRGKKCNIQITPGNPELLKRKEMQLYLLSATTV